MTMITGREPGHWHRTTSDGTIVHALRDPRTIPGLPESFWSADEKAYVRHLTEHERREDTSSTVPLPNDPPLFATVLQQANLLEEKAARLRELISNARKALAAGKSLADSDAVKELKDSFGVAAASTAQLD